MYNLKYATGHDVAVNYTAISADGTTTGTEIDVSGYEEAHIITYTAARTDGTVTPVVYGGEVSASLSAITDEFLFGTEAGAALSAANVTGTVGVSLRDKYLRVDLVASAVTDGLAAGALVLLSKPRSMPVA